MEHPEVPGFNQCVTFSSFPSRVHETLYNLFCLLVLYGFPLSAIILSYGRILCEIHRQAKDSDGKSRSSHPPLLICPTRRRMGVSRSDNIYLASYKDKQLYTTVSRHCYQHTNYFSRS
ncbi:hypothetical protein HPB48_019150 [Haemaphysalis longicornis]|uniref:Uncharacterized protein n=1 Tax=Haemaphysalis longicornis TaxID=44386 RepID=A0A9J6G4E5_HAELO|nr:hypothetical protein HPB48_019150 [Haemaphysalis longicornis]